MNSDLYALLGVGKSASEDEIRAAYRKLAKANHPDLNPGNKDAEQRFKEIATAYAILGDTTKRKRYDAGEIDETGEEKPERKFYRHYAESEPGFKYEAGGADFSGFEDLGGIFADLFARSRTGSGPSGQAQHRARGSDVSYRLTLDFLDAVNGVRKRIELPDGRSLNVTVPPGVEDGQLLRLSGMGEPGIAGGPPGHAVIEISIQPHPRFKREGNSIKSVLPITLGEAVSGASVRIDTVSGPVDVRVPKGSNTGTVLRLRGKGVPDRQSSQRGDHLVELRVMLPEHHDADLERLVQEWESNHPYDPRKTTGA